MSKIYLSPYVVSCMGGWCSLRGRCEHYHAARVDGQPSERLCLPGKDGVSEIARVQVRPAKQREAAEHGL